MRMSVVREGAPPLRLLVFSSPRVTWSKQSAAESHVFHVRGVAPEARPPRLICRFPRPRLTSASQVDSSAVLSGTVHWQSSSSVRPRSGLVSRVAAWSAATPHHQ